MGEVRSAFASAIYLVVACLAGLLPCTAAAAGKTAAGPAPGLHFQDGDATVTAPLVGSLVHVQVTGVVARATVTQIFLNPTDRTVEATYVFPLPDGAAVDSMRMTIGDRVVRGEIQTSARAEEMFQQARDAGHKAALLENVGDDVFTAQVTRLGAGESVEIEIGMQLVVGFELDRFQLRFPMVVGCAWSEGGQLAPNTALRVEVAPGFQVSQVISSHHIATRREPALGTGGFSVELVSEVEAMDRDFDLAWLPERGQLPRAVTFVQEVAGERYALLMVIPPDLAQLDELRLPRETVFVVDTSGSMSGPKIEQAVRSLQLAIGQLQFEDLFQVFRFSSDSQAVFEQPVQVDGDSMQLARGFIASFQADGGTDPSVALREALSYPASGRLRQVVLITDGEMNEPDVVLQVITDNLGTSRLFPVAIGTAPNQHFIKNVAEIGRGTSAFVADDGRLEAEMGSFLRKLESPVLQDIEVSWDALDVSAWPQRVPDLYAGEPVVLTARIGDARLVTLRGRLRDRPLELTLTLPAATDDATDLGLDRAWAGRQIDHLLARIQHDSDAADDVQRVTDLGLRHGLVTPYTSLVAVDWVPADTGPQDQYELPADVSGLVEEQLVVTSQAPLVDPRSTILFTTVALEEPPSIWRDAWAIAAATAGVSGRFAGAEVRHGTGFGLAPIFTTASTGPGQATWSIDGARLGDLESYATPHAALALDRVDEVTTTTAGADAVLSHPGVKLDMTTRRASNIPRVELSALGIVDGADARDPADSGPTADGERLQASFAGPLRTDRAWLYTQAGHDDSSYQVVGGLPGDERLENRSVKVQASASDGTFVSLAWRRGERRATGLGAGPSRDPAATLDLDAVSETWQLKATWVASSHLFVTGYHDQTSGDGTARSAGGVDATAAWSRDGRFAGGVLGGAEDRRIETNGIESQFYFDVGSWQHELKSGVERGDTDDVSAYGWPGDGALYVAGEQLGDPNPGVGYFLRPPSPDGVLGSRASRAARSAWLQDQVDLDRLHFAVGLRWDDQDGSDPLAGTDLRWRNLSPRLAASWTHGDARQHLVRASWSRYAHRLSRSLVAPDAFLAAGPHPGAELWRLADASGDAQRLYGAGFVQLTPTDEAPTTDEWRLSVAVSPLHSLVIHLDAYRRDQQGALELRDLVRGDAGLRLATAGDYVLDHSLAGSLPDGSAYQVPVYSLDPALDAGTRTWAKSGFDLETTGARLTVQRPWRDLWNLRLQVHYADSRWKARAGASDRDPTPRLGVAANGRPFLATSASLPGFGSFPSDGWSAEVSAGVRLFENRRWETDVMLALHAREGYRLPWFAWDATSADGHPRQVLLADHRARLDDVVTADLQLRKEIQHRTDLSTIWTLDVLNLTGDRTTVHRELNVASRDAGRVADAVGARGVYFGVILKWQ